MNQKMGPVEWWCLFTAAIVITMILVVLEAVTWPLCKLYRSFAGRDEESSATTTA